jgi:phenylacetate-CoA ligase
MLSSIDSVIERTPLWRPAWREILLRMREHPDAPRWNTQVGDRITGEDMEYVRRFEEGLKKDRSREPGTIPGRIVRWALEMRERSQWFRKAVEGLEPNREFDRIPTMTRSDLQLRLEEIIPDDEPLGRLIINPTSGTTGQPILAPNHPRSIGCYDSLIQYALRRHSVSVEYDHTMVAAIQVCFQRQTIVYNTVHSLLGGAGFAKVNLDPGAWPGEDSASRYIADMAPVFISGDPIAFEEMLRLGVGYKPKAFLSCALALTSSLRLKLQEKYSCPIVDFYSLNETGPIAFSRPDDSTLFQILPSDIYVEIVDGQGNRLPDGQVGEICVTGGRNPFLPLLRYRTGDLGAMWHDHGRTDDPAPLLKLAEARRPVLFLTPSGGRVNPIDISRILRQYPVRRHQCLQRRDLSLLARLDCPDLGLVAGSLSRELELLFGREVNVELEKFEIEELSGLKTFTAEWE